MLYEHHIAVDWSANGTPKSGKDSIWISEDGARGLNPRTRALAMDWVRQRIDTALTKDERLHIGFDFAFGLSRGAGQALLGEPGWEAYWRYLHTHIEDDPDNRSNRFEVGAMMNAGADGDGPFWGHPHQHSYTDLHPKRCVRKGEGEWPHPFPATRHCDARQRGAQEIWKLAYTGSVGSQMLLGIAALEGLRREFAEVAIWPFETRFAEDLSKPILVTEIYPSAKWWEYHRFLDVAACVDEAQVMAVSGMCAELDAAGELKNYLEPFNLPEDAREVAIAEEGWILGL